MSQKQNHCFSNGTITEGFSKPSVLRWLIMILFVVPFSLVAQTYFFDNFKTTEGMESSKVYAICQTPDGFVWLGTDVGITKFDGSKLRNYTVKDGLAKGGARTLLADSNGNVWIGHEGGGITRSNGKTFEILTQFPVKSNVTSFCEDKVGNIWVTTYQDGAICITNPQAESEQLKWKSYTDKALSDMVFRAAITRDGSLFLITDIGIKQYMAEKDTFVRFAPQGLDTYFQFSVVLDDRSGNRWYGTYNGGLYRQKASCNTVNYFDIKSGLASNWITDIIEDRNGNVWIGHWDLEHRGGITRISPDGAMKVFDVNNGLHDNKVWCLMEDKEGNILVGTTEHGLDVFKGEAFVSYSVANGLANNQVNAIVQDEPGNYWFGTNGGITVFDGNAKKLTDYTQQANQISNLVRFLKLDKQNNIWLGTEDQGVQLYNANSKRFVSTPEINQRLPRVSKSVWAMDIDSDNQLWVGTLDGLILYDITKGEYVKTFGQIDGLPSNEVTCIYCAPNGNVWVGCKNAGVSLLTASGFDALPLDEKITPTAIVETSNGHLAIGTEVHGVFVVHQQSNLVKHYTISEGLYTNNIRFLTSDENGNIFVGTTVGLNKITADGKNVLSYAAHNGYVGIESKANAAYKDRKGQLWFGTVQGVICHTTSRHDRVPIVPTSHIVDIQVNGEPVNMLANLEFPSFKNNVLIHFSSISITDPLSVGYRIMLEGTDKDWQNVGSEKSANYRSLPPGRYTFKVQAVNAYGMVDESPASISFVILAPIYKRPWFIVASVIAALMLIWLLVYLREKNLLRERKLLAERVTERTLELSQANEQLAARNKDITDSIQYAKRIQFAILPADIPYANTFVLFKPKDIVSGDFYWAHQSQGKEFLAVVDCTGHGVPGAFMSVIGHTSLNKIVIEQGCVDPAEILTKLNKEVEMNLHQKENDIVNDGMDMALICYDPQSKVLEFAGANNPLWLIRNGELTEVKASRYSIGRSTDESKLFVSHRLEIAPNDSVYLFSDGYADQFGGPEGKKFKIAQLRRLFLEHCHLPMDEQYQKYDEIIETWKGHLEQVDDILVVGRCFK